MTRLGTALSFLSLSLTTEVMTRLDTVLFFVPLGATWDGLDDKLDMARDRNRNNFKLIVR